MIGRIGEVVIDCRDPQRLAEFWQRVLGGYVVRASHDWVELEPPTGVTVSFQRVADDGPRGDAPRRNRVHLDVDVHGLAAATSAAEAFGARRVGEVVYDELGGFQVMLDPEGNEFCLVDSPDGLIA